MTNPWLVQAAAVRAYLDENPRQRHTRSVYLAKAMKRMQPSLFESWNFDLILKCVIDTRCLMRKTR